MELDDGQARAWSLGPNPVLVERLQLFDSAGRVLLRRSIVRGEVNTVPLVIGMEDVWKGPTYFRWGRTNVSNARSPFEKIKPIEILRRYSSLGASPDGAPTPEMLRDRLELLVSQPSISENDPAVGLIDVWFRELGKSEAGASERDMVLLERIIAHPSITKYSQIYNVTQALDAEGFQRLRRAVARRIVKATKPDEWIAGLASIYSRLPPEGADSPSPDETKILADPELRKYTPELIVRESAKGAEAVARLMSWLKFHTYADRNRGDDKWDDSHRRAIDAVRRGLCVLGPEARAALPQVEAMVSNGAVPMALSDADEWQFVMARLGKPLNTISKPPNRTGTVGDYRSLLANRLDGFDAKESCRANWI